MSHQHATLEDSVYFGFVANNTSGSAADGTTPLFDVRLGGAAASAAPVLSGTPDLLTHANYGPGAYEVAVAATAANGFATGNTYSVFVTVTADGQTPGSCVGTFTLAEVPADVTEWAGTDVVAGAIPAAAADAAGGLPVSDAGGLDLDAQLAATNEVTAARMGALTDWIDGGRLDVLIDAIKVVTDAQAATGTGLTAVPWNAAWDAEVQSEVNDALVALHLDHLCAVAESSDVVDNSIIAKMSSSASPPSFVTFNNVDSSLGAIGLHADGVDVTLGAAGAGLTAINLPNQTMDITGNLSGSVGSVTGAVGSVAGNVDGTVSGLNDISVADLLTTAMTESYNADGAAPTVAQALHLIIAYLMERSVSGTVVTANKLDGSTEAATFNLDDDTNPTSVTRAT